ncbi:hypothetical protein P3W45_000180 [Vairimorpha bombi]
MTLKWLLLDPKESKGRIASGDGKECMRTHIDCLNNYTIKLGLLS